MKTRSPDKSDMLGLLLDFPSQCRSALDLAARSGVSADGKDLKRIVFVGLGGSAIGGDLVRSYLYFESKVPIAVVREYDLPAYADRETLVFISSYSGETEETVSAYEQAKKNGSAVIVMSSGGALEAAAKKDGIPFIAIPRGIPPRCALGYMSIMPLCVLGRMGLINDVTPAAKEAIGLLEEMRDTSLNPRVPVTDNIAKYLAGKLFRRLPVIYASSVHFDVAGTRFRGQLNENSKVLASTNVFPEMNHNEIVGWQNPAKLFKRLAVVLLRDSRMHPRVALRMDITRDMLRDEGLEVLEVWSRGEGLLSRIFSLIYIGDFASYYLALKYRIDPTPVDRTTYLKKRLAESA